MPREIQIDDGSIFWVELRPEEGGRYVIVMRKPDGSVEVLTPDGYSARSRVHEYGGGVYCVSAGKIVFVNEYDQRLYSQETGSAPVAITSEIEANLARRFADGTFSPDGQIMLWVQETHKEDGTVLNEVVALPADGSGEPSTLLSGRDFYSNPRFSPDGTRISWLSWDHPNMPWDGTELWTAHFDPETLTLDEAKKLAGGSQVSIFQPEWSPSGVLHYISDETGWANLYSFTPQDGSTNLAPMEAEFDYPQWLFGFTTYAFLTDDLIFAAYKSAGLLNFALIDKDVNELREIGHSLSSFENPSLRSDQSGSAWFFAGSYDHPPALYRFDLELSAIYKVHDVFKFELGQDLISRPEQIFFNNQLGSMSYGFYYPPYNPKYVAPPGETPPLIVMSHSGPTSSAKPHLQLEIQFWTTRGFAVVDVDYSGSTGYGRAYRERLNRRMGIIDVDDCIRAAVHLAEAGLVDPTRLIIRGSSAGGYITLCALTSSNLFTAGCSYYGIADLERIVSDTHKFESHYLGTLIGPLPEAAEQYYERSPLHQVEHLNCPMIIIQGEEDTVVTPQQSKLFVRALKQNGIPFAYLEFENEGHGFKRMESIREALEAEEYFYKLILGLIDVVEDPPVEIVYPG